MRISQCEVPAFMITLLPSRFSKQPSETVISSADSSSKQRNTTSHLWGAPSEKSMNKHFPSKQISTVPRDVTIPFAENAVLSHSLGMPDSKRIFPSATASWRG